MCTASENFRYFLLKMVDSIEFFILSSDDLAKDTGEKYCRG